jgi:hypothetical protein
MSPAEEGMPFHLDDELWAEAVLEFACAHRRHPIARNLILRSLTPLYLARVASFVRQTEHLVAPEVEERIEELCLVFENLKPGLIAGWNTENSGAGKRPTWNLGAPRKTGEAHLEVTHD